MYFGLKATARQVPPDFSSFRSAQGLNVGIGAGTFSIID